MKMLTVRLPETLVNQIEAESRARRLSKSDVVRERLTAPSATQPKRPAPLDAIQDLIGSVDTPADNLGRGKNAKLRAIGYGCKRPH